MSAVSNGRVLRIALAGSIAVHLVIAAVVYSHPTVVAAEPPPQHIDFIKVKPPPPPTPTPQPPKPAVPHPQHHSTAVRPAVKPVHIAQANPRGPSVAPPVEPTGIPQPIDTSGPDVAPTSGPIAPPAPSPTPKPACSAPDVAAKTVVTQSVDVSDDDRNGFTGTAKVRVDLDATGAVVGTSIYESTGYMQLDRAALNAARESRYAPEERDCKNVAGSYLFTIDFQ